MPLIQPVVAPHEQIVKTASAQVNMPPAAAGWSRAVLNAAYKQVPILQTYALELNWDDVNEARGMGVGKLHVKEASLDVKPDKKVVVPVVVKNRRMYPLDVMVVDGETAVLTEEKLAAQFENLSLGGRQEFSKRPGKSYGGGLGDLTDPGRMEGGSVSKGRFASVVKLAAATAGAEKLADVRAVALQLDGVTPAFREAIEGALSTPAVTIDELAAASAANIPADLMEFRTRRDGSYQKTAVARAFYAEVEEVLTRAEAESILGTEKLAALDSRGKLRFVSPTTPATAMGDADCAVTAPGLYKVASGGALHTAVVFTDVVSLSTGQRQPGYVVSTRDGAAWARDLGGIKLASLESHDVGGVQPEAKQTGFFSWTENGARVASELADVALVERTGDRTSLLLNVGKTQHNVHLGHVKAAARVPSGLVIPSDATWHRSARSSRHYADEAALREHLKTAREASPNAVHAEVVGRTVLFHGTPMGSLSGQALQKEAAARVGVLLGIPSPEDFFEACKVRSGTFLTQHSITPMEDVVAQEKVAAEKDYATHAAWLQDFHAYDAAGVKLAAAVGSFCRAYAAGIARGGIRAHAAGLRKTASVLPPDRETVDTVLALNFLNPDNLRLLRNYLPHIEKTAARLAEVLLATRMGLEGDPEPIRLAMRYVDRAATQLRHAIPENA